MKKIISVFLALCLVFSLVWFACIIIKSSSESCDKIDFNMCDSSELIFELKSKGIDVENTEKYNVCVLIKAKENPSNGLLFDASSIVSDNIDDALREHREKVKKFYTVYNEKIVSTLGLKDYNYYISFYSPYIELVFDGITEYAENRSIIIDSIAKNQKVVFSVNSYATYDVAESVTTVDDQSYSENYLLDEAFDDIGVSTSSYTGNGINVGILDGGVPDNTENLKAGKYTFLTMTTNLHSSVITSIIGGSSGIAENVNFYCKGVGDSIVNDCNYLINTCNVNIINISIARASVGYYSYFDSCIDNLISTTGCTIVIAAGNEGLGDGKVVTPGCAMNAITVGSINHSQNLCADSSWKVSDIFLFKPDVVAPGGRLWDIPNIPNVNDGKEGHSGTSYAAPMVAGTIALLMEEFPTLKANPALVKSVLHIGAEKLPSQTSYYDLKAGFGLINYQNMRNCLLSQNYYNFAIHTTALEGDTVLSYNVTVPYFDRIEINSNCIVNSSNTSTETPLKSDITYTNYTIKIFDLSTSTYVATSIANSSVDYLSFTNEDSSNTSFRIDIVLETDSASNETEYGSMAYELIPHVHSYTQNCEQYSNSQHKIYCECGEYVLQNHVFKNNECFLCGEAHTHDYSDHYLPKTNSTHISFCACGNTSIEPHVVSNSAFSSGNKYAICLVCGGTATTGITLHQGIGALPRSENGSFILPNGIIVLADEDMEAYFSGTLEFVYPDGNLETE